MTIDSGSSVALLALGLAIGLVSGMVGIGGGIFLVPALVLLFGLSQHEAQGTSIAVLVLPVGIFAALEYWRRGHVHASVVLAISAGFVAGAFLGALLAGHLGANLLRRLTGFLMLFVALQMLLTAREAPRVRAILPVALAAAAVGLLGWIERRTGFGHPLRRRLHRWVDRRRPPATLEKGIEYHI